MLAGWALLLVLWPLTAVWMVKRMRMSFTASEGTGGLLNESSWGSATINGTSMSNCVKLVQYENGWMVKMMPVFLGGKLWFPLTTIEIGPMETSKSTRGRYRTLKSGNHQVELIETLADEFTQLSSESDDSATPAGSR